MIGFVILGIFLGALIGGTVTWWFTRDEPLLPTILGALCGLLIGGLVFAGIGALVTGNDGCTKGTHSVAYNPHLVPIPISYNGGKTFTIQMQMQYDYRCDPDS